MNVETFFIQPFVIHRKKLTPSQKVQAKNRHDAEKRMPAIAARSAGAAVVHVIADDETGEPSSINVLAQQGDVPENFEEQIRGG